MSFQYSGSPLSATTVVTASIPSTTTLSSSLIVPENSYTTLRTFSTTVADSEPPSSWVTLPGAINGGFTEIKWEISDVGGTVPATEVRFKIWKRVGGSEVDKVDDFTIDSSQLKLSIASNQLFNRIYNINADEIAVTVTFSDGTTPNITGTIKGRIVSYAGLQESFFKKDPSSGHVIVQPRGYDSITDSQKTTPLSFECDISLSEALVIDTTGLTAGTEYFYPSADGVEMQGFDSIAFEYKLQAGAGATDTIQTWFEATIGTNAWTNRNNISLSGTDLCGGGRIPVTTIISGPAATIQSIIQFDNLNITRIRQVVKPITGNSRTIQISIRRKVRGS